MDDRQKHAVIGLRFSESLRKYASAVEAFDKAQDDETRAKLVDTHSAARSAEEEWLAGVDLAELAKPSN